VIYTMDAFETKISQVDWSQEELDYRDSRHTFKTDKRYDFDKVGSHYINDSVHVFIKETKHKKTISIRYLYDYSSFTSIGWYHKDPVLANVLESIGIDSDKIIMHETRKEGVEHRKKYDWDEYDNEYYRLIVIHNPQLEYGEVVTVDLYKR